MGEENQVPQAQEQQPTPPVQQDQNEPDISTMTDTEFETYVKDQAGVQGSEDSQAQPQDQPQDQSVEDQIAEVFTNSEGTAPSEPQQAPQGQQADATPEITPEIAKRFGYDSVEDLNESLNDPYNALTMGRDRADLDRQKQEFQQQQDAFFHNMTAEPYRFIEILNQHRRNQGQPEIRVLPQGADIGAQDGQGAQPSQDGQDEWDSTEYSEYSDPEVQSLKSELNQLKETLSGFTKQQQQQQEQQRQTWVSNARRYRDDLVRQELAKAISQDSSAKPFARSIAEMVSHRIQSADENGSSPSLEYHQEPDHVKFAQNVIRDVIGSFRKQLVSAGTVAQQHHQDQRRDMPGSISGSEGATQLPTNPEAQKDVSQMTSHEYEGYVKDLAKGLGGQAPGLF